MTQEDKELLLKDICSRLPYENVVGKCELDASYDTSFDTILQTHKFDALVYGIKEDSLFVFPLIKDMDELEFANEEVASGIDILDFKPYLFPLSSMTKEILEELNANNFFKYRDDITNVSHIESKNGISKEIYTYIDFESISFLTEYFHSHHIDYRGLIEKGLAIDATGLNIY